MKPFLLPVLMLSCLLALYVSTASGQATMPSRMTEAIAPDDPMLPDGHRLVAWLDCGVQRSTADGQDHPQITLVSGHEYAFPGIAGPLGSAEHHTDRVVYRITGLAPERAYVLGFTWWDEDVYERVQSVAFSRDSECDNWDTVLPPIRATAFNADKSTWARVLLPLAAPYDSADSLRVAFVAESGPNAVVNELWLLEREEAHEPKRILIVTGDDYAGHDWRSTAPALASILREDERVEVSICESPAILGTPLLSHYDAVALHFKDYADRLPLGTAIQEGLRAYVANGGGLLINHFGCGAFQEWPEFVQIAGRVWNPALRAHDPHGKFTVRIADRQHPITQGMNDFETTDELYTCLDGDAPITVLCDAVSVVDGAVYPMAFIVENTGGRVFHCVLGHDATAYHAEEVRSLYQRAAAWTLGIEP